MPIELGTFDVIIGIDWLVKHDGVIVCGERVVRIPYGNKMLIVESDKGMSRLKVISCIKARKYVERGCHLVLAHVTEDMSKEKQMEDVLVIHDFPKVFHEELPGLPPLRQVEFQIDLVPRAAPVARAPYRLAPSEMKEFLVVIEFGDSYKAPPKESAKDKGLAGRFSRECRSSRSKDRGKRESYKKDPKVEEPAPKAMIAIDGIGWNWSYMAEEDEASKNHALVAEEEEVPTKYALMAKTSSSSDNEVYDDSFCSKSCRKNTKNLNTKISKLNEELSDCETDLYNYKRGLPEFVDDTVTDYTRPTPSIGVSKSVSKEQEERWKSNNPFFFEQGGSSGNVVSNPMIKFVKESGFPNATKVNNTKNARKPTVKYVEMYRNTSQSTRVKGNQRN
nr:reverse transcriptase domain-containing protein [Tanacetum cinerariifolium]